MKRGRKSPGDLVDMTLVPGARRGPRLRQPADMDVAARRLWREIEASRPVGFFGPADAPLLVQFVTTVETYIPKLDKLLKKQYDQAVLQERDRLIRLSLSLARALRLNVSSRTRPDSAALRDAYNPAGQGPKPWQEEPDEQPDESPAR